MSNSAETIRQRVGPLRPLIVVGFLLFASIAGVVIVASLARSSEAGELVRNNYVIISLLFGVAAALLVFSIEYLMARRTQAVSVIASTDGRISLSKAQTWWWTLAILTSFVAVFTAGYIQCASLGLPTVPPGMNSDLLLVLGLSAVNVVAARAIVIRQISSGQRRDQEDVVTQREPLKLEDLILGPGNRVDIYKLQLVAWTVIAIGIFGVQTVRRVTEMEFLVGQVAASRRTNMESPIEYMRSEAVQIGVRQAEETAGLLSDAMSLPSIGAELLLLMGISQATYLGGKLVTDPSKFMVLISHAEWPDAQEPAEILLVNAHQETQVLSGWKLALLPGGDMYAVPKAVFPLRALPGQEVLALRSGQQMSIYWTTDPTARPTTATWNVADNPPADGDALVLRDATDVEINRVWLEPPPAPEVFG